MRQPIGGHICGVDETSATAVPTTTSTLSSSTTSKPATRSTVSSATSSLSTSSTSATTTTARSTCQELRCPSGQTCKISDDDETSYCDAEDRLLDGVVRIDANYSIIDNMTDFKREMRKQIASYLSVDSAHVIVTKVTIGSIVVYFDVDQQTDTSLEDVLAGLARMNSTGIVIIYVGQTYEGRLVNFTLDAATPGDSTGAPSHTDNFTFILVLILACVLGPLIIAIIVLTIVIIVVKKKSKGHATFSNGDQEQEQSVMEDKLRSDTEGTDNASFVVDLGSKDCRKSSLETFA